MKFSGAALTMLGAGGRRNADGSLYFWTNNAVTVQAALTKGSNTVRVTFKPSAGTPPVSMYPQWNFIVEHQGKKTPLAIAAMEGDGPLSGSVEVQSDADGSFPVSVGWINDYYEDGKGDANLTLLEIEVSSWANLIKFGGAAVAAAAGFWLWKRNR